MNVDCIIVIKKRVVLNKDYFKMRHWFLISSFNSWDWVWSKWNFVCMTCKQVRTFSNVLLVNVTLLLSFFSSKFSNKETNSMILTITRLYSWSFLLALHALLICFNNLWFWSWWQWPSYSIYGRSSYNKLPIEWQIQRLLI
jgi:hypothetical protein